jgi:hypothetical protein
MAITSIYEKTPGNPVYRDAQGKEKPFPRGGGLPTLQEILDNDPTVTNSNIDLTDTATESEPLINDAEIDTSSTNPNNYDIIKAALRAWLGIE